MAQVVATQVLLRVGAYSGCSRGRVWRGAGTKRAFEEAPRVVSAPGRLPRTQKIGHLADRRMGHLADTPSRVVWYTEGVVYGKD